MPAVANSALGLSPSYTYTSRGTARGRGGAAAGATRPAAGQCGRVSQTVLATSSTHDTHRALVSFVKWHR